jgi:hypothetical protein
LLDSHSYIMVQWTSPLKGYENAEPLPTALNPDGRSLYNPPGLKSAAYEEFQKPIDPSKNGFDFHSEFWTVTMNERNLTQ